MIKQDFEKFFPNETWPTIALVEIRDGNKKIQYVCQEYEIVSNWLRLKTPYILLPNKNFLDQGLLEFTALLLPDDDIKIKTFKRDVFIKLFNEKSI